MQWGSWGLVTEINFESLKSSKSEYIYFSMFSIHLLVNLRNQERHYVQRVWTGKNWESRKKSATTFSNLLQKLKKQGQVTNML